MRAFAVALAKRASKPLSSTSVMFSCLHPPFGLSLSAAMPPCHRPVVISHGRAVHRAQRHAHCRRNRRLRQATLTQQRHLDALARRCRYFPPQRRFQPPHLGFAGLLDKARWRQAGRRKVCAKKSTNCARARKIFGSPGVRVLGARSAPFLTSRPAKAQPSGPGLSAALCRLTLRRLLCSQIFAQP